MTFQLLIALCTALWLTSIVACALALWWSFRRTEKRFIASLVLSLAALLIGYLGLTHFRLNASKTVNGETVWALNSRWFFIATLMLGALTLACAIWKHRKAIHGSAAD